MRFSLHSFLLLSLLIGPLLLTHLQAQEPPSFNSNLSTEQKPWTDLDFQNDPNEFQFAIVTDRTGGHREGVFAQAVEKINMLMPEFVISVGDLIEGYSGDDKEGLAEEWEEFNGIIEPLKMPFFYLPGNHDIHNEGMRADWNQRYGAPYYSFRYKDVLFLCVFTNEEQGETIGQEQLDYFRKTLADNEDVRWTLVFMHHPLWVYPFMSNFDKLEAMLEGRNYTVYAGHQHTYRYFERKGTQYIILATTGGGSGLRGNSFGQFDQIAWMTMTEEGPVMANVRLDGILPPDIATTETVALSRELVRSTAFASEMLIIPGEEFTRGVAYMSFQNQSEYPIHLNGRFYHHHNIHVSPVAIHDTIPAKSTRLIPVELSASQPFDLAEQMKLEMDWEMGYDLAALTDLTLTGTYAIEVDASDYDVIPTEEGLYIDQFSLSLQDDIPYTDIRYTLDSSEPTLSSPTYTDPLIIREPTQIKARIVTPDGLMSKVDSCSITMVESGEGLMAYYYEYDYTGSSWRILPDFQKLSPTTMQVADDFNLDNIARRDYFWGIVYKGKLTLDKQGTYTFYTSSDDGSRLYIDGQEVVDNDLTHSIREESGQIELSAGTHLFELHYFQDRAGKGLGVSYSIEGGEKQPISFSDLSFDSQTLSETILPTQSQK